IPSNIFVLILLLPVYVIHHLSLLSFPTRRSSDLSIAVCQSSQGSRCLLLENLPLQRIGERIFRILLARTGRQSRQGGCGKYARRSEEHTSELQSRFDIVCRLLLDKKKNTHTLIDC